MNQHPKRDRTKLKKRRGSNEQEASISFTSETSDLRGREIIFSFT